MIRTIPMEVYTNIKPPTKPAPAYQELLAAIRRARKEQQPRRDR